jgi:hypothetical protein
MGMRGVKPKRLLAEPNGKLPSRCRVCRSEHRAEIELALARRVPARRIAARFGNKINHQVITRHGWYHLPPSVRAAMVAESLIPEADLETFRVSESNGLLSRLVWQRAKLHGLLQTAEEDHDLSLANSVHGTLLKNFETTGKLLGQFITQDRVVQQNLVVSADYLQLRAALMRALYHHPAARQAVLAELRKIETRAPTGPDVPFNQPLMANLQEPGAPEEDHHDGA